MMPAGTSFRRPLGIQPKPAPIDLDSDGEDPPVHHSSDEETQGLSSNLKPTVFKRGGRADLTPDRNNRVIKESPRPATIPSVFTDLLREFNYKSPSSKPADDMASAYSTASRRPRPPSQPLPRQTGPAKALPVSNAVLYKSIDDIPDYVLRNKTQQLKEQLPWESVQRCFDALAKNKANLQDAAAWLTADEEKDADGEAEDGDAEELSSASPVVKRGVAVAKAVSHQESSQPVRATAKQEVKAPSQTIAEKYGSTQAARRQSQLSAAPEDSDEDVKPKRRLLQGRRPARSPTPPSSPPLKPPQPLQRMNQQKKTVTIADDSESDSGVGRDASEEPVVIVEESTSDKRLLEFFNGCTVKEMAELSAQPDDVVSYLLDKRPFESLEVIRAVTQPTAAKSKSKGKLIGEKIVNTCNEMWAGFDAVDELVEECEGIAKPIQDALKGWGVGTGDDGELHLMNLDEAHDSGIGTPASSCPSDDIPAPRSRFLSQPKTMNPETSLKDYQLVGLNWLNLMWSQNTSCILADDMGLGKTCQVIAFLAYLQQKRVDGMHLVIVPGSTLENWLREFAHFAPELNVVPYYGSQAERPELQFRIEQGFDTIDVIVTTYDMAVKPDDNKFLRKSVNPMVCVYDEAHALRNPQSDRYKQLTRIPADFRVLLTGTPLQNNLQELVAVLAFIMPGLFAEKRQDLEYIFKHKASTKDADHAALLSAQRITRARSMMTPFILRRKKQQVLDLPTKHSRVEYCDMTPSQASYYAGLLEEAQEFFASKVQGKKATGRATSNILMSLRKAAIHPLLARRIYDDKKIDRIVAVLLKHAEYAENKPEQVTAYLRGEHHQSFKGGDYGLHCFCATRPYLHKFALKKKPWMDAGKIAEFRQLITRFAANGDRVLVFSQFTTMMNILEAVLESLDIRYMRLDGQTDMQVRQDTIDKFTREESIPVFMLSTKAGGAGINLACANKVIVFDSGFNPQDDIQAENRAHRVGQTREVEVIRLVTRGTIEEQIHALGESKLALDERVAGEGATAAEEKQAEKSGEQMVENMFLEDLRSKEAEKANECGSAPGADLKHAFKNGLESAGVRIASKQARF